MLRQAALELIRKNVQKHGFHVYLIEGGLTPRYMYTIGLSESYGSELIFAGGLVYTNDEAANIVDHVAKTLLATPRQVRESIAVEDLGSFELREVDASWVNALLLGAIDYYKPSTPRCLQIVPDAEHFSVDVPHMFRKRTVGDEPAWKWLTEQWQYGVPEDSKAITDIAALKGQTITEAMRWGERQWELFATAGDLLSEQDLRAIPLAVMLGIDPTLEVVTRVAPGQGFWRDPVQLEWNRWDKSH